VTLGPAERPFKLRLLLFLYSNSNIAGCAVALCGPVLLFAGVIGPGWLVITAGLYTAGYAAGWMSGNPAQLERRIEDSLTVEQTLEKLDALIRQAEPHLSPEMMDHLLSVRESVTEVLPRLVDAGGGGGGDLYTVRETVLRYLPETLANFVALPPAFRNSHPLRDGRTARVLLSEQLAILDSKMREIVANVASSDVQALLANGKFLEMKFQQPDFLADR
jgi:hypothetical protein